MASMPETSFYACECGDKTYSYSKFSRWVKTQLAMDALTKNPDDWPADWSPNKCNLCDGRIQCQLQQGEGEVVSMFEDAERLSCKICGSDSFSGGAHRHDGVYACVKCLEEPG